MNNPWTGGRGRRAELGAMGGNGTLFSIVTRLATSTAKADWDLCRTPLPGADPNAPEEEVLIHPAIDLWNRPNEFYTGQSFVETFEQHIDLVGETWWVVAYDEVFTQIPLEMWPVRPDRMQPVTDPYEYIVGYMYTAPDGEQVPLEKREVIFIRTPNPVDPYRGMGPVQSILVDLESARFSAEWNRNFFLNGAEPGGVIEAPEGLSDREFNKLKKQWDERHRGVGNAHKVAILEKAQWKDRQFNQKDMQFAELRNVGREVIREAYGMHPQFVGAGDVGHSRAEAEAAEVIYARWYVEPRLDRIKDALNQQFLKIFGGIGQGVYWKYCSPVPNDEAAQDTSRTAKATAYKTLVDAGVHPDDAATVAGLPAMRERSVNREPTPAS